MGLVGLVSGCGGGGKALGGARTTDVSETDEQDRDGVRVSVAGHVDIGVGRGWTGWSRHFEWDGGGVFFFGLGMLECCGVCAFLASWWGLVGWCESTRYEGSALLGSLVMARQR